MTLLDIVVGAFGLVGLGCLFVEDSPIYLDNLFYGSAVLTRYS